MTADSLIQTCAQLGIKLDLKANRLRVDAPRGTLTASLRQALAVHKSELMVLLELPQQPARSAGSTPQATSLISESQPDNPQQTFNPTAVEDEQFRGEAGTLRKAATQRARKPVKGKAETLANDESPAFAPAPGSKPIKGVERVISEKGMTAVEDDSGIPSDVLKRLNSTDAAERETALTEVARFGGEDAFRCICRAFDDESADVRNAGARALFALAPDRAATFTRALREGSPERRRLIGEALASSGLARDAVANLTGESRQKTYDSFSLLFLMAKAGEVQPLLQAIEDYPNLEVRIAVVKLLALCGQPEIVPAFRRLAVRSSLPSEVRSAVMEAIYQITSHARETAQP